MKIHRVKTRLVNSYIVEYPDQLLVVDVAVKCHRQVLGFLEQELRRPVIDISLAICTHDDPDHIGGLAELANLASACQGIPYASASTWRKMANDPAGALVRLGTGVREAFRARSWQMYLSKERDERAKQLAHYKGEPDINPNESSSASSARVLLKHQQQVPGFPDWQVIHTPGHSWDSCCYYHADSGSLISGDTLLGSAKLKRLVVPSIYSNKRQTRVSLKRLGRLKILAVYPGHGSPQFGEHLIENIKLD
ncbi:MAG: hydroxyacylglutathione hydrolase [Bermanella sp.]|jgi:hydroxyacylglutathione hydrolase